MASRITWNHHVQARQASGLSRAAYCRLYGFNRGFSRFFSDIRQFPSRGSRHHAHSPCRDGIGQPGGDFFEERARQQAVGHAFQVAGLSQAQIRPRPGKTVGFGQHDPGALIVQPQASLGFMGYFDGKRRIRRRRVGDGEHGYDAFPVVFRCYQDHGAGPVFHAFLLPSLMLCFPQVGIADDQAWSRLWERQGLTSHFVVERGGFRRRLGGTDGLQVCLGQIIQS